MKLRTTLSVVLTLCVLSFSLMTSNSTAKAATARTYGADTGMVTLGPNQFLRVTVANTSAPRPRVTTLTVTFDAVITFATCSDGVCTHTVTSQTTTAPVTLMPGQAASYDIVPPPGASAVRCIVRGDNPDGQANALIIDSTTGAAGAVAGILYAAFHGNDL